MWPFRRRDIRAADTITIGEPATGYGGGLAPSIAAQISAGTDPTPAVITREIALKVPAVRRGVRLICGATSSMPLRRYRDTTRLKTTPFLEQPEDDRAYCTTLTLTVEDLIFHPYAWWWVRARDRAGYPARVTRLIPENVSIERHPDTGKVIREYVMYEGTKVPAVDLIRFDGPDQGFLVNGVDAVVTALRQELAARQYATPEVPAGILRNTSEIDLDDDEIEKVLDKWALARRTRSTGYLNAGLAYDNPAATPESLQMVEAREESALQIARALCLAPRYVNTTSGDSMTYSTTLWERQDLIDFTFRLYTEPIEQRLSMPDRNGSPANQRIRFDMDAFLRGNASERAGLYSTLIPIGVMDADEARAAEGLPPREQPEQPAEQQQPEQTPLEATS